MKELRGKDGFFVKII